jgi:hypothetical protein
VTATAASETQIDVSWTDNATDETGYRVEWSANGTSGWTLLTTTAAGATSAADTSLTCNTTRFYRVRTVRNSEFSAWVNASSSATTDPCPGGSTELIANGSFETDAEPNNIPDMWTAKKMQIPGSDYIDCVTVPTDGACSFTILGNGTGKKLVQKIITSGVSTDTFVLSFDTKGTTVPNSGSYIVKVKFFYTNGDKQTFKIKVVSPFPGAFAHYSLPITITRNYNRIDVTVQYGKSSGRVWFDDVSLLKN